MVTDEKRELVAQTDGIPLRDAIALGAVTGGEPTNPLWRSEVGNAEFAEAMRRSLDAHGLLAPDPGAARYILDADLRKVAVRRHRLDITATASVHYRLSVRGRDGTAGAARYDEPVVTPYTATMANSILASSRLRLANEGAIRTNIASFIDELVHRSRAFPEAPNDGGS